MSGSAIMAEGGCAAYRVEKEYGWVETDGRPVQQYFSYRGNLCSAEWDNVGGITSMVLKKLQGLKILFSYI